MSCTRTITLLWIFLEFFPSGHLQCYFVSAPRFDNRLRYFKETSYIFKAQSDDVSCTNIIKVSKGAKIRSQYNQVPHPTQNTNRKVTNSQLDTTNESQEVSPFPAGDHKAHINTRAQRHGKHKTEHKHNRSTKEVPSWKGQ